MTETGHTQNQTIQYKHLMPLMNTSYEPGKCREYIRNVQEPVLRKLLLAGYCYFSGRPDEVTEITEPFLDEDSDIAAQFTTVQMNLFANVKLRRIDRAIRDRTKLMQVALEAANRYPDEESAANMVFFHSVANVMIHLESADEMKMDELHIGGFPEGMKQFAFSVIAHHLYLQGKIEQALATARAGLLFPDSFYPVPYIYNKLIMAVAYMNLHDLDRAEKCLWDAWHVAEPDHIIEPFTEYHLLLMGLLEYTIRKTAPYDYKEILHNSGSFRKGWTGTHNTVSHQQVATNLTTTEFIIGMLASRGWNNREIGRILGLSVNSIKKYLSVIYEKLGIGKRTELQRFMP